jgi:hypothetical protein
VVHLIHPHILLAETGHIAKLCVNQVGNSHTERHHTGKIKHAGNSSMYYNRLQQMLIAWNLSLLQADKQKSHAKWNLAETSLRDSKR